jgi:hypothetical protein
MHNRKGLILLLLVVLLSAGSRAQDAGQGNDTQPAAAVPTPFNTGSGSLAFTSELARTNYLTGGVSIRSTFDDNALNTSTDPVSDFTYSILPNIALKQSRGRLGWTLNYAGGFTINQRLSSRNQGSHDLGFEAGYRLSPHVNLLVREHFYITTNFFDQLNQNTASPQPGVLESPNQTLVTPLSRQIGNTTAAEINYQFSSSSVIGATGTFYQTHYRDAPVGTSLLDTQSEGGEAFYNHRVFARNWIGATYRFQRLTFSPGSDELLVHSVLVTDTMYLTPSISLSLFAGPQYVDMSSQVLTQSVVLPFVFFVSVPVSQSSWSPAAGASFRWNGKQTSFLADFAYMVNSGGGLLAATQTTSVDAAVRRQLTRAWAAGFAVGYATNDSLSTLFSPNTSYKTTTGSIAVDRRLGKNLSLGFGYARVFQQQYKASPTVSDANHNRAWVSVSYNFTRPLGR